MCTNGSWTKPNGFCHAYYHKDGGFCYHTKATADECPSTGRAVKAWDLGAGSPAVLSDDRPGGAGTRITVDRCHLWIVPDPDLEKYIEVLIQWLRQEPNGLTSAVLSTRKAMALPEAFVRFGLAARPFDVPPNYHLRCNDGEEVRTGLLRFDSGNVARLPPTWQDRQRLLHLLFLDQLKLRVALPDWV